MPHTQNSDSRRKLWEVSDGNGDGGGGGGVQHTRGRNILMPTGFRNLTMQFGKFLPPLGVSVDSTATMGICP